MADLKFFSFLMFNYSKSAVVFLLFLLIFSGINNVSFSQNIDSTVNSVISDSANVQFDSLQIKNRSGRSGLFKPIIDSSLIKKTKIEQTKKHNKDTLSKKSVSPDAMPIKEKNKGFVFKHENDTLHSPKKAMWYSAALPGLGQMYNQKYWKVPVIYTGFATCAYFIFFNNDNYQKYKTAYIYEADNDSTTDNYLSMRYSKDALAKAKDYYRRNLELTYIITAGIYLLNIVDATVDAHLYTFNISDDLSMRITPTLNNNLAYMRANPSLKIIIKF